MGKSSKNRQPNAPELQQILLESPSIQQPPHNPYYPSLSPSSHVPAPPPYSDLSNARAMSHSNNPASANYARLSNNLPRHVPATVIVQQPITYNRREEKYQRKVRKFNNEMLLVALLAVVLSVYANSLYSKRNCINFLVHQPAKDVNVRIQDVRDAHIVVAYGSIVVLFVCLINCLPGERRNYSCYLLLIGLSTFVGTIYTGYLAYLAYYSPCSLKVNELLANSLKTVIGAFENLPSPDKGLFNESNVFQLASEDREGVIIFFIDLFNFFLYLSAFVSAILLC